MQSRSTIERGALVRRIGTGAIGALAVVAIVAFSPATADAMKLASSVMSAGAGNASGTSGQLRSTLGQLAVGRVSGASTEARQGFWYGGGSASTVAAPDVAPAPALFLAQNRPNPFNPSTAIRFSLERDASVRLDILDPSGRLVTTLHEGAARAGAQVVTWDGRDALGRPVASGVYLARLSGPGFRRTMKMNLLK